MVERDLAKVDVAGSTPVSRSNFHGKASRPRSFFHPAIGRGTQVVRERSAKPLYVGSIPTRASNHFLHLLDVLRSVSTLRPRSASFGLDGAKIGLIWPQGYVKKFALNSASRPVQLGPAPSEPLRTGA